MKHAGASGRCLRRVLAPVLACSLFLLTAGCGTVRLVVPEATPPARGVGLEVRVLGPLGFPGYTPDRVYFERRCPDAGPQAPPCTPELFTSNFARDGRLYLLNAPAGDYAPVAVSFSVLGAPDLYVTYLPAELVASAARRLDAGRLLFAGHHVLSTRIGVCPEEADADQMRTARRFDPGVSQCGLLGSTVDKLVRSSAALAHGNLVAPGSLLYHYRGAVKESRFDEAAEREFLGRAREDLAPGGWVVGP